MYSHTNPTARNVLGVGSAHSGATCLNKFLLKIEIADMIDGLENIAMACVISNHCGPIEMLRSRARHVQSQGGVVYITAIKFKFQPN